MILDMAIGYRLSWLCNLVAYFTDVNMHRLETRAIHPSTDGVGARLVGMYCWRDCGRHE